MGPGRLKDSCVLIWERLGPYHIARINELAYVFGGDITVIEIFKNDKIYAWDAVEGGTTWSRVTLFQQENNLVTSEMQSRVVLETLDRIGPQCVGIIGYSFPYGLGALRWCLKNNRAAVLFSDNCMHDHPRRWHVELIKSFVVKSFGAALVGGVLHADYLKVLGLSRNRIRFGYNVVDSEHFARLSDARIAIRSQHGAGQPFFLAITRFIPKKNLVFLLRSYAAYRARMDETAWRLVILGDGALRADIEAEVISLGLTDDVDLPGFKQSNELPGWYQAAGAFLLPSVVEHWGLVVNEALSAGLPVLVSDRCGCVPELVHPGRNGWVLDPTDAHKWADAMVEVSLRPELAQRMSGNSRTIISDWGTKRFAKAFMEAAVIAQANRQPQTWFMNWLLSRLERRPTAPEVGG